MLRWKEKKDFSSNPSRDRSLGWTHLPTKGILHLPLPLHSRPPAQAKAVQDDKNCASLTLENCMSNARANCLWIQSSAPRETKGCQTPSLLRWTLNYLSQLKVTQIYDGRTIYLLTGEPVWNGTYPFLPRHLLGDPPSPSQTPSLSMEVPTLDSCWACLVLKRPLVAILSNNNSEPFLLPPDLSRGRTTLHWCTGPLTSILLSL